MSDVDIQNAVTTYIEEECNGRIAIDRMIRNVDDLRFFHSDKIDEIFQHLVDQGQIESTFFVRCHFCGDKLKWGGPFLKRKHVEDRIKCDFWGWCWNCDRDFRDEEGVDVCIHYWTQIPDLQKEHAVGPLETGDHS